mmetsp:Transcript_42425/g.68157  ORF Transcript_42425/g.68157 Transcript_42425/m.68157 type:complete len:81 (+) Transcript_42425:2-244(+)
MADARVSAATRKILSHIGALLELLVESKPACSRYTPLAHVYLDTFRGGMSELREALRENEPQLWADWLENNMRLWSLCRQ